MNRLGNALLKLGVQKGDRVAMMQVNTNQCVEAYFAAAKIGGIYVPLNFRAKGNELTYMLNTAEANTIFIGDRYIDLVNSIKPDLTSVKNFISLDSKQEGMLYYEDMIASSPADEIFTEIGDDDTTILMYTAGTTGFPKGVMLTHNSFSIYVLEKCQPARPGDNGEEYPHRSSLPCGWHSGDDVRIVAGLVHVLEAQQVGFGFETT